MATIPIPPPACSTAQLLADGRTAHFTPSAGFVGIASFDFTVKGSDSGSYTAHVAVAVQP